MHIFFTVHRKLRRPVYWNDLIYVKSNIYIDIWKAFYITYYLASTEAHGKKQISIRNYDWLPKVSSCIVTPQCSSMHLFIAYKGDLQPIDIIMFSHLWLTFFYHNDFHWSPSQTCKRPLKSAQVRTFIWKFCARYAFLENQMKDFIP